MQKLLIANRGEIAIRIAQAAAEMGIHSIAVFPEDDASSLHRQRADDSVQIPGTGARAYLDQDAILNAAREHQANAIHPGYGFLSENADFAEGCENAGMRFVGPTAAQLRQFGDKGSARSLATECGVPLIPGTNQDTTLAEALAFFEKLNDGEQLLIKAISGGGGRGMRRVETKEQLEKNYERCRSESKLAFGNDAVYVEALIPAAKHIEIQIVGDGQGHLHGGIAPPELPDHPGQNVLSGRGGRSYRQLARFQALDVLDGTLHLLGQRKELGPSIAAKSIGKHEEIEKVHTATAIQIENRFSVGIAEGIGKHEKVEKVDCAVTIEIP